VLEENLRLARRAQRAASPVDRQLDGCGAAYLTPSANPTGAEYYSFVSEAIAYGQQFSQAPPRTFRVTAGMHF